MKGHSRAVLWLLLLLGVGCVLAQQKGEASQEGGWGFWLNWIPEGWRGLFKKGSAQEGASVLSEAEILQLEAPRTGIVAAGQTSTLKLNLPTNNGVFPDVMLTLSVADRKGDADIFCVPPPLFNYVNVPPGPDLYIWKSDHSHGNDVVFISKDHELYDTAKSGMDDDKISATFVEFFCSVVGFAAEGTEYTVEVDVDYSGRVLVQEEKQAMQEIFNSCCAGKPDTCEKWKETAKESDNGTIEMDFCHFHGSICNSEGQLIRLEMSDMGLTCDFPVEAFKKLKAIQKVNLAKNNLEGSIGDIARGFVSKEVTLQHLDLSDNYLSGDVAEASEDLCRLTHNLRGLVLLNLARNDIRGAIPNCLFDETSNLVEFVYDDNVVDGGIPNIARGASTKILSLSGVGLTGSIPSSLGQAEFLIKLDLSRNALVGTIPEDLTKSTSLRVLNLQNNGLQGNIPGSIVSSSSLQVVNLHGNALSRFSMEWDNKNGMDTSKLMVLRLAMNQIEGYIPDALLGSGSLQVLDIRGNRFSGPLPSLSGMMSGVVVFLAGGNNFEGEIPLAFRGMSLFNKKALDESFFEPRLDLSRNRLSGRIPSFLYVKNVPQTLWGHILLGGNDFDLSCPLTHNLQNVKDLSCGNAVIGGFEGDPVVVKEGLKKSLMKLGIGDSPASMDAAAPPKPIADAEETSEPEETTESEETRDPEETSDTQEAFLFSGDEEAETRVEDSVIKSSAKPNKKKKTGLSDFIIATIVLCASAVLGVVIVFLYRRHKQMKWDKAVEAVLVRDLELGPKTSTSADNVPFCFQKISDGHS